VYDSGCAVDDAVAVGSSPLSSPPPQAPASNSSTAAISTPVRIGVREGWLWRMLGVTSTVYQLDRPVVSSFTLPEVAPIEDRSCLIGAKDCQTGGREKPQMAAEGLLTTSA
jgi:hypothetical protein